MSLALSYADSVTVLKERADIIGNALSEVTRVPRPDDDPIGPTIFRARLEDAELSGLCLPGLFVARSEMARVRFAGAELRLAAFNWNGLLDCDFTGADLRQAELRCSLLYLEPLRNGFRFAPPNEPPPSRRGR